MKTIRLRSLLALLLVTPSWLAGVSCASTTKGDGSESHFTSCTDDGDCAKLGAAYRCIEERCERPTSSDPDGSAPPDGAGGSPVKPPPKPDGGPPDGAGGAPPTPDAEPPPPDAPPSNPECRVPAVKIATPWKVTFQFTNATNEPLAVWQGCTKEYDLLTCDDGYSAPIARSAFCTSECPSNDCVLCGACLSEPAPVTSAAPVTDDWSGESFDVQEAPSCACYVRRDMPSGKYRLTVPVYDAAPATNPGGGFVKEPLYVAVVDFVLDRPDKVIEVPIDTAPRL